jgi:hypothetical protein
VLSNPRAPRTPAADVYAFGLLLLELMTGRPAWCNTPLSGIKRKVLAGIRPAIPRPPVVLVHVYELISECWAQHPSARPSFREVAASLEAAIVSIGQQCAPRPLGLALGRPQSMAARRGYTAMTTVTDPSAATIVYQ